MRAELLAVGLLVSGPGALLAQRPDSPTTVAERQIAAFNHRDLDGMMALFAEDAVVYEFPSGTVLQRGKPAIRAHFAGLMKQLPQGLQVRVEPRVVDGAFVVDNERWDAPPGERNQAVWMYEIRNGLIRRSWTVQMP